VTRRRAILFAALVMVGACATLAAAEPRYDELKRVIDRNTGFAHMTRGVNMYTLIALRECVGDADVPVLARMLRDRDHVIQLAAAGVLVDMGATGRQALQDARSGATDARTRMVIEDALRETESATRRPLAAYPLTEKERRGIRSCAKAR
jgi:hypothetical protein